MLLADDRLRERLRVAVPLAIAFLFAWSFRIFGLRDAVLSLIYVPERLSEESLFVQQALKVEFPAPIDYGPIQEVCARTHFRPGLLFTCEGQHGGIGMLRNQMLKCIRYAIHGGGALVIPSMALRNAKNLADIETATEMPMEYMLDRKAFVRHLTEGCPGMRLYDRAEEFPFYDQRQGEPLPLLGDQFEPDHPPEGLQYPRAWRRFFDDWLVRQSVQIQSERPVHIQMEQSFLEYPVRNDGDAFVHEFGKVLSFRNDTRALAEKVLFRLKQRFALPINPADVIHPDAYYSAHLRLESDAIWAWPPDEWRFSRMEDQFDEQYRNLRRTGLSVVYVASGNQTVVRLFADYLNRRLAVDPGHEQKNVTVVTKQDLLEELDRQRLDSMTFDQQALVDFMVMFKSSAFMGVAHSSFPWNVALRRHELSKYAHYANEGSDLLRDEYSVIMGMMADYPYIDSFVTSIWP
ncbi:hypothetical protein CMQ_5221 [Grosmannia clavigera kw1407]|uniref:Alternative oxidase n=1 Tax=Grosmannia clavigera (strain kw1407 / UAMH 11150) TaxID=655863 RepID=F0XBD3_GROCL|nr:uncharacterized protein CMQ_5221 [Grosmannia clavigera kw1407]EFX04959.1 hypothetical protein CMQ_5221 [Grosmannia clavigera kw1407]